MAKLYEQKYDSIPTVEGLTYPQLVMIQANRLGSFFPETVAKEGGLTMYNVLSAYFCVSILNGMVRVSVHKNNNSIVDYFDKVVKIEEDLGQKFKKLESGKEERFEFMKLLLDWYKIELQQFGRIGLLPTVEEDLDFATKESLQREKFITGARIAFELVAKRGEDIVKEIRAIKILREEASNQKISLKPDNMIRHFTFKRKTAIPNYNGLGNIKEEKLQEEITINVNDALIDVDLNSFEEENYDEEEEIKGTVEIVREVLENKEIKKIVPDTILDE